MTDELFDTPEKTAKGISDLQSGIGTSFWELMCKILDGNIQIAKDQLENGIGDSPETPESINRVRDRLKLLREIRNTPEDMIKKLSTGEEEHPNPDPFDSVPEQTEVKVDKVV